MNILAIDYGTKRIGLARWSDLVDVVLPFGVVSTIEEIVSLVKDGNIDRIVMGLPLGLEGEEDNFNVKRVKKFSKQIEELTQIPIDYCDERFSSCEADSMGGEATRDEKSAMVILQSYLVDKK